ncbi:hypothetical protein [Pseudomonas sp. 2FG]|uniref:hypothetical protein n=1 Tax=Pseudomonas sp. 2FG TaxID=2502191 RepID=UPI0010F9DB18|nr:hypothetical protein [Pseudomonas sp. 2FG]
MSLQALLSLGLAHPAQLINGLALFFAVAGSWLLVATRLRERRAVAQLAADTELGQRDEQASLLDEPTLRLNRFFNGFGFACLAAALLVSWLSIQF